jgi:hypothetical protein
MGRKQVKEIIRHTTLEDLNKKIKKEEKSVVCRFFCNLAGPVYPILQINPHP